MTQNVFEIFTVNSLEKVLPSTRPSLPENYNTAFQNEKFSFQIAYCSLNSYHLDLHIEIESDIKDCIKIRCCDLAPCTTPVRENSDDYVLTEYAALIPDILSDNGCKFISRCNQWQSLWVTVKGNPEISEGRHKINFTVYDSSNNIWGKCCYELNILKGVLPECDIIYTNWFHYDCLEHIYNIPFFTDEYNSILKSYIRNAVEHGINTLYIPLFTPPLDTEKGKERRTVQLVGVKKSGDDYTYDFDKLNTFIDIAINEGTKYFEMSHLFTQWGAHAAPKIIAEVDGTQKRIFGWDTASDSEEYKNFLKQFLPELSRFLKRKNIFDKCFFHISDEPSIVNIDNYKKCKDIIKSCIPDCKTMDALSNYSFYQQNLVDIPVVATECAKVFADNNAENYFVYYCCMQKDNYLSNRHINMPSQRNRILGFQLYINNIKGFLHWGYNFYNSYLSKKEINPYIVTDSMGAFQSGDAFIVYPGEKGPVDSLRNEVFFDALQDYSALKMLESKIGREKVVKLLTDNGLKCNLTDYPRDAVWHINLRKKINSIIAGTDKE